MNRSLPIRLYLTLVWLVSGLLTAYGELMAPRSEAFFAVWIFYTLILLMLALVVTVSQPDELSLRVRRAIPRAWWKRLPAFFFYNGAAQGLAWIWGLTYVTVVGGWGFLNFIAPERAGVFSLSLMDQDFPIIAAFGLYIHAYALTGLFLHRTFFAQRTPLIASLCIFAIPAAWSLLPCLVLFLLNRLTWETLNLWPLGNVFNLTQVSNDDRAVVSHFWFAAGWSLVMMVANLPWFIRQVRAFKPLERTGNQPSS